MKNTIESVLIVANGDNVTMYINRAYTDVRSYQVPPSRLKRAMNLLIAWSMRNPHPEIIEADYE